MRGLARLLRRNPTLAERALWTALVNDRRFAGAGFKRQVPIGPHIVDIVSFPLRMALDLEPSEESAEAATARGARRLWLMARGYRVLAIAAADVESKPTAVLDDIFIAIQAAKLSPSRHASETAER